MYRMEGSPKLKHCCPCECWSQSNRVTALFHSAISADLATALWSPAAATLPPDTPFRAATRTKTCLWVAKNKQIVSGFSYLVWVQWGFLSIPSSSPLSSVWALWMNVNLQWCTITVAMVQPCHMCHCVFYFFPLSSWRIGSMWKVFKRFLLYFLFALLIFLRRYTMFCFPFICCKKS